MRRPLLVGLFLGVPSVEFALLWLIGSRIGLLQTLLIIVFTGLVGAELVRRQGSATWRSFRHRLDSGEIPTSEIADGVMLLAAGLLLLTPGFLSDTIGFLLLVPPLRKLIRPRLVRLFSSRVQPPRTR